MGESLLFFEEFYLLALAQQAVFWHQIVFQDVEKEFVLFEDFEPVRGLFRFAFLAHVGDESLGFPVDSPSCILFGLGGSNNEKVVDILATFDNSVEVFGSDLFSIEVVEDSDGVVIFVLKHFERGEYLSFV